MKIHMQNRCLEHTVNQVGGGGVHVGVTRSDA